MIVTSDEFPNFVFFIRKNILGIVIQHGQLELEYYTNIKKFMDIYSHIFNLPIKEDTFIYNPEVVCDHGIKYVNIKVNGYKMNVTWNPSDVSSYVKIGHVYG